MKNIALIEYQDLFLKKLSTAGKSFNTTKNYRTDLNIFNQFLISKNAKLTINEITPKQMQEYAQFLEKKYNSPNSIRRRVQALRLFFDFLIENKLCDHNPVKKVLVSPKVVDLPNPPGFHMIKSIYQGLSSQKKDISSHAKLLNLRNQVLLHLVYSGSLKVSDIEKLSLNHITLAKDHYRILIAHEKRDPFTITMPKSFGPVHKAYVACLEQGKKRDDIDFDSYLFNGNPFRILKGGLSARGIEVIFKEFSKSLKQPITAKSLRQAGIFRWILEQKEDSRIKEWMGVQPQYSLKPYKELLKQNPEKYCFMELEL